MSRARVEFLTSVDEEESSHCAVGATAALVLRAQQPGAVTATVQGPTKPTEPILVTC